MALRSIPFYASLLGRGLADGKKANNGIVLVYGAIEIHAMGEKGCVAGNETIGKETGLSTGTVANCISLLHKSGWVKVTLDARSNARKLIEPLLSIATPSPASEPLHPGINPPSSPSEGPLHPEMNIDNNRENKEVTVDTDVSTALARPGDSSINELFDYWQEQTGYPITSRVQANRRACYNLIRKHTVDGVQKLIRVVSACQSDRYAPNIADFVGLQADGNRLLVWAKKQQNSRPKVTVIA